MQVRAVGDNSFIIGADIQVGSDVTIGPNTLIRAHTCYLGDHVRMGANNQVLVADTFQVGAHTILRDRNRITGRHVALGVYNYWESDIEVGQGGAYGPRSCLYVGDYGMVCDRVILNLSDTIRIGDYVGIGNEVNVWTHGAFLPVLEGFPADFGPVTIGDKVWLPARSEVLPNRTIGNHVVIGINSLVNKDIPDGAFAAGRPIRILETNKYPCPSRERQHQQVHEILNDYREVAAFKALEVVVRYHEPTDVIYCNAVQFDLKTMAIEGDLGPVEQDFRDYLRRRGIKFYTSDPFRWVMPPAFQRLLDVDVS